MFKIYKELKPTNHKMDCESCEKALVKNTIIFKFISYNEFKNLDVLNFCSKKCFLNYMNKKVKEVV